MLLLIFGLLGSSWCGLDGLVSYPQLVCRLNECCKGPKGLDNVWSLLVAKSRPTTKNKGVMKGY